MGFYEALKAIYFEGMYVARRLTHFCSDGRARGGGDLNSSMELQPAKNSRDNRTTIWKMCILQMVTFQLYSLVFFGGEYILKINTFHFKLIISKFGEFITLGATDCNTSFEDSVAGKFTQKLQRNLPIRR